MLQEHSAARTKRGNPVQPRDLSDTDENANGDTSTDCTEVLWYFILRKGLTDDHRKYCDLFFQVAFLLSQNYLGTADIILNKFQ